MKVWGDSFDRSDPARPENIPGNVMLLIMLVEIWKYRHYGLAVPELMDLTQRSERQIWRYVAMLEWCGVRIIRERAPAGHQFAGRPLFRLEPAEPFAGFLARAQESMRYGRRAIRALPELVEGLPLFETTTPEAACA